MVGSIRSQADVGNRQILTKVRQDNIVGQHGQGVASAVFDNGEDIVVGHKSSRENLDGNAGGGRSARAVGDGVKDEGFEVIGDGSIGGWLIEQAVAGSVS